MIKRILAFGGMSIGFGLMVCSAPQTAVAQQRTGKPAPQPRAGTAAPQASTGSKPWTPPKTPWGDPDLRGIWPLTHLISTPFQRPERFGDRRFLSEDEYAAALKS